MKDKESNAERFLQGNSFQLTCLLGKTVACLMTIHTSNNPWVNFWSIWPSKSPPVVVDPRRPQAIFLMQENYFGSVMFGALSPREALDQYKEAMKNSWGRN